MRCTGEDRENPPEMTAPNNNNNKTKQNENWWWKPDTPERPTVHHEKAPFHLVDFLMQFRWMIIIPIVLPLSFLWARIHLLRAWIKSLIRGKGTEQSHAARVARVVDALRAHNPDTDGLVCTARPSFWSVSVRQNVYKSGRRYEVNLSDLADVVAVDLDEMTVTMEPYVTMGYLTATLLPMGVCVAIVPEYDDLTVGGLVCGYGIEGSSHKYGLFYDQVISMEIVLAKGRLVTATRDNEYADLFHAVPWSYGALGVLVGVKMHLVKTKPYMRITYYPVAGSIKHMCEAWKHFLVPADRPWAEYVEGLIFSSSRGVIMTADYADEEEARQEQAGRNNNKVNINMFGRWYKPWFHRHVQHNILDRSSDGSPVIEYMPTRDYYHRHTRSLYWQADLLVPMGNHVLFRYLFGWLMPPRVSFLKLTTIGKKMNDYYSARFVAQDILVPLRKTAACMELMHDEFDIYPVWLCPHVVYKTRRGTMLDCEQGYDTKPGGLDAGDTKQAQMFTDVGIWYTPGPILRGEKYDTDAALHTLEQWLIRNHGYQTLYAYTELSEDDFWRMFDKTLYERCRDKYDAKRHFMDVYYKVGRKNRSAMAIAAAAAANNGG